MNEPVCPDTDRSKCKSNTWLNAYAKNVTSQEGEDGIIEKILEVINEGNKWCVEFGCWDGKKLSNTFNLINNKGYSAVLIECDKKRFSDLQQTFGGNERVVTLNSFVGFEGENRLDTLLKRTDIPIDFDLLSIDIDGNDYHVWDAVRDYRPKVVVIEYNATIPNSVEFVQPRDMTVTQGSSLLSIAKLAKSKDYELVAVTGGNAMFVDLKYFGLFGIRDNSVKAMRTDESAVTYIFCGYDGTVFVRGCGMIPWQKIAYDESRAQQLPKWARKRVGDRNILRRKLRKIYLRFRKRMQ